MDPVWTNVAALLRFDETVGTSTTTDISSYAHPVLPNAAAPVGSNIIVETPAKFGTGSAYITGTGYFSVHDILPAAQTRLNVDYTIECWANIPSNAPTYAGIFHFGGGLSYAGVSGVALTVDGLFAGITSTAAWDFAQGGTAIRQNLVGQGWQHVAVVQQGTTTSLFIGGQRYLQLANPGGLFPFKASQAASENWACRIGQQNTTGALTSNIDEFRITIGEALYTTAFYDVPTAPFPGPVESNLEVSDSKVELVAEDTDFVPTSTMDVNEVGQQVLFLPPSAMRVYDSTVEVVAKDDSFLPPTTVSVNEVGQQIAFIPQQQRLVSNSAVELLASGNTPWYVHDFTMELISGLPYEVNISNFGLEIVAESTVIPPTFSQQACWIVN